MEEIFNKLKDFIVEDLPEYLEEQEIEFLYSDTNIICGAVDLSRYEMHELCAILPENQQIEDYTISEWNESSKVTIAFLFQKEKYEELIKKMCKVSAAFKNAVMKNPTLKDRCEDSQIGNISYFYDAGAIREQLTVVEIELTILTNNSF